MKSMIDYARENGTTNTSIVETNDQTEAAYPMRSYSKITNDIFSSKLDFSLPADKLKGTFDFGAKYSYCYIKNINDFRRWNTSGSWTVDNALSNVLHFREQILAEYLTFSRQWKHFYYTVGLRVESSFTNNKSDVNDNYLKGTRLFPNITFNYKSKTADYELNYNKRISRPDYSSLNASVLYHDSLSTSQGNPELKATIYNTIAFSLLYRNKIKFGVSYVFIESPQDWLNINDKDNVERYTNYKVNTKRTYAVTCDIGGNFTLGRWSMQPTMVFLYRPYTIVDNGEDFSFKRCQYRIDWTNQIALNHNWSIDADANFYKPGYSFTTFNHQLYLDLGMSKSLFDHRLFLQVSIYRSFFNWKQSYDYSYKYYNAEFVDNDRFYCKFSLKYNLGVKRIKKDKGNQEELNRLSN
nr:outer membrane beta-barrel family protein [Prevotella sp.]